MKRVYLGKKELTTIATIYGGVEEDNQKWVDFFNRTLTEFDVPNGVTKIDNDGFSRSSGLTTVTLPESVAYIADYAFYLCPKITQMTVKATTPPSLGNSAMPMNISVIYVPSDSVDTYKSADEWKNYADKIQAIPA